MTRDEILQEVKKINFDSILLEMATGVGKSRIAIELLEQINAKNVLIVVPKNVLKQTWDDEFKKWSSQKCKITYTTYISFVKYTEHFDCIIYDECHHLSERCIEHLKYISSDYNILLSATVGRKKKWELLDNFKNLKTYKVSTKEAIEGEILPEPKIILIPLELNNTIKDKYYPIRNVKNPKGTIAIELKDKWKYLKNPVYKNWTILTKVTELTYYRELSSLITFFKNKGTQATRQMFLRLSGERLKTLSTWKENVVLKLLHEYKNHRTLTFCKDIQQTQKLGRYCINSQNDSAEENLVKFNTGKIKHITACNMLDEGVNLTSCQIGIYAVLNSSERMIVQKLGRLLRHPEPIILIPFFKNTREEEIVNKMCEHYNKTNIIISENI